MHRTFLLTLALAACTHSTPASQTPTPSSTSPNDDTTSSSASPAPATQAADDAGALRIDLCMRIRLTAGYECVPSASGGAIVLTHDATPTTDACAHAECPSGARCESTPQSLGDHTYQLPRCVVPNGPRPQPMRDPCASYLCPTAYHCTAPADAPYCVPDHGEW